MQVKTAAMTLNYALEVFHYSIANRFLKFSSTVLSCMSKLSKVFKYYARLEPTTLAFSALLCTKRAFRPSTALTAV